MKKQTAVQIAIEKIDEQIEIAQVCRIEASKVKDATSMERHHGMKIALVFMRQELVNLLEMEKQQIIDAFNEGRSAGVGDYIDTKWGNDTIELTAEQYYNETFKLE
jgi:hypothetical protein